MLETLAGPFNAVDLDGNSIISNSINESWFYDDDVGLVYFSGGVGSSGNDSFIVQLDGTACLRSTGLVGKLIPDYHPSRFGQSLFLDAPFYNTVYEWNKYACIKINKILYQTGVFPFTNHQVRLADRYLVATNFPISKVKWHPLGLPASSFTDEADLTNAGSGFLIPNWSLTRDINILAISYRDGNIIYYNHVTKTQAPGFAQIGANKGAWYSRRHNVWVKVNNSNQIIIHAATPRPSAMTAPSGSSALRGRTTTFSVTVTGDAGEPCPDELINWSLLAGAIGQLKATQSKTNQNGQASIDYVAPVIGTLGDVTIRAELKF